MQRIAVVGVTGSGKTTFARALSQRLHVPHLELDALYWLPNWTTDSHRFQQGVEAAVAREQWIIDGNYSRVRPIIWCRADTLVWLDYSLPLIMSRLVTRTLRRAMSRELLWGTNRERLAGHFRPSESLFVWALKTQPRYRREYAADLQKPEYAHLRVVHLAAPRAARAWLAQLPG